MPLARRFRLVGLALLAAGVSHARAGADSDPAGRVVLDTEAAAGLLEPPTPVEVTFAPEAPAGVVAPASLGPLRFGVVKVGEPYGPAQGFVVAQGGAGKETRLYVDGDADGNLSNGGDGQLEDVAGDTWKVRRWPLVVRPTGAVPYVFVRTDGEAPKVYAVGVGRRTTTLEAAGKKFAIAIVDVDGDGKVAAGGADTIWFDANADGAFDAAHERFSIPAVVTAGASNVRLSVDGTKVVVEVAKEDPPSAVAPARTPDVLAYRLAYASASNEAPDEKAGWARGAKALRGDDVWAWMLLLARAPDAPVRAVGVEAVADPEHGADRSEKALEALFKDTIDAAGRVRVLGFLGNHPGAGAAAFLGKIVDDRNKPMGDRQAAVRALARFEASRGSAHKAMQAPNPPELRAAAYQGLADKYPQDKALHVEALDMGHPGARGAAIGALADLGDGRALALAKKESGSRFAPLRGAAAYVLINKGKPSDWKAAFDAAQDDAPVEPYTDLNRNSKRDDNEPFTDQNGNGIYDRDAGIRDALRRALRANRERPELRAWLLDRTLAHTEPWVRGIALDVLGDYDDGAVRATILARLEPEKERDLLLRLIEIASRSGPAAPVPPLLRLAASADEGIAGQASAALVDTHVDAPEVRALVTKLLQSSKWADRVQGAEAAMKGAIADAVPALVENLKHNSWPVVLAAIEALSRLRPRAAFEPLVEVVAAQTPGSRLSKKANEALFLLTGMELPEDADQWRSWLASHMDFAVPAEPPVHPPAAGRTVSKLYGLVIESTRIVYVIDRSGSMQLPDTTGERVRTRWETLEEQLLRHVQSLPKKGARFNVIVFSDTADAFRPHSVDATDDARAAVKKFVEGISPHGETNVWSGLALALEEENVDTIVLLTDGAPTAGEFTRPEDIRRELVLRNRFRRIAIDTISVGQDSNFLRDIARENGGTYVRK